MFSVLSSRIVLTTVFGVLFIASLYGCASTPEASRERDADAKQFSAHPAHSTLYVYRIDGSGESDPVLWVDGKLIGTTLPRTYFRVNVEPGRHMLNGMAADNGHFIIETRPGEIYFILLSQSSGNSVFQLVNSEKGRKILAECCVLLENWAPGQRPLLR